MNHNGENKKEFQMIIRDILRRIMGDDIQVEYKVKVRIGDTEHEIIELITEDETVFICCLDFQ